MKMFPQGKTFFQRHFLHNVVLKVGCTYSVERLKFDASVPVVSTLQVEHFSQNQSTRGLAAIGEWNGRCLQLSDLHHSIQVFAESIFEHCCEYLLDEPQIPAKIR